MRYILQICTGAWDASNYTTEAIIERIRAIASKIPVDKVIIGWSIDRSLYQEIGAFLHGQGIQMILWLPCFSEISGVAQPDETRDLFGKEIVVPLKQPGEDFVFCCPSSPRNIQIVESLYEECFAGCGFDGVFLDKVRSQSFVAGVPSVLSCGCERCQKAFLDRGVDLEDVRSLYEEKGDAFFDMRSYPMSGEFELAEKWFAQTLEEDPGDFEANRGMILCAGKWRDFPDIRLNEKLKFAEWPKIEERLKAAKENSNYNNLEYFEEFQKMLESVKTYHELAGKEDQESLFERLTAQKSFKLRYKVFAGMDRKYRTTYMNKPLLALSEKEKRENLRTALGCGDFVAADREYVQLLMNHPNDAEALRARVLCAGRWKTIDEISLDQKMSDGLLNQISGRIKIAKDNSSWDYYMYYELFGDVEEILRENFKALQQKESYEAKRKNFEDQLQEVMLRLSEKDKELFDFEKE